MPTPLYDSLKDKIRDWANRDSSILTDPLVSDFLDYSADESYRKLRIPPLENTYTYPAVDSLTEGEETLQIPPDTSKIISITRTESDGKRYVFDKKLDINTFLDEDSNYENGSYIWRGELLFLKPKAALGDVYEIHYYRRLPDLDAVYDVNQSNLDAGLLTQTTSSDPDGEEFPVGSGTYYYGNEVANWLRDENERCLLLGAVAYAFAYLGDEQRSDLFLRKRDEIVQELNQEEVWRKVHYSSNTVSYDFPELG